MKKHKYRLGDLVVVNEEAKQGLPGLVGKVGVVKELLTYDYDYRVEFLGDVEGTKLKEKEVQRKYYRIGQKVNYTVNNETVEIAMLDYPNLQVGIKFEDGSHSVISIMQIEEVEESENLKSDVHFKTFEFDGKGKFQQLANEIGEFTDIKNRQYGSSVDATYEMMKVLMERYTYDESKYLIPKELVKHMLLTVRMMDKQNRIFNNPTGKGDSESPYRDLAGYSLIGIDMVEGGGSK